MARTGRRPGRSGTREAILDAARRAFAEKGYDGASIRDVAAAAGVDPALVHHYFKTKEGLFVTAVELPVAPDVVIADVLHGEREQIGERLVTLLLSVWDAPERRSPMLALVRSAVSSDKAARMLREFMTSVLFTRVAGELGVPDAALRANLAASQIVGLVIARYVVGFEPLASTPTRVVVAAVAPTIQRYLTGDLEGLPGRQ